jgi:hypothetical protein
MRMTKRRSQGRDSSLQGAQSAWEPAGASFESGEPYFRKVLRDAGLDITSKVFTSRHPAAKRAMKSLRLSNVPAGFRKWQLPFALKTPTNFYITEGQPRAVVRKHVHAFGAGFRFILSGTIRVGGQSLKAGDWFFVPEGQAYSYTVGSRGVELMAGYECCCQGWPCC